MTNGPGDARIETWNRDGLALRYRDYWRNADGPPLLCLHGLTRNSRDFEAFAQHYAGRFRVVAPDFRGRGLSNWDPEPSRYNPATYAADVLALLDELAIEQAIFVGTSLGGLVTMVVAAIQPERIAGAILNDVGPELDERGLNRIRGYLGRQQRFATWRQAGEYVARINGNLPDHFGQAEWIERARKTCRERDGSIMLDYDMAIAEPFQSPPDTPATDMWPLFHSLAGKPLLILRGERSDLLSPASLARMAAVSSTVSAATVAGVGHAPDLTEPEAIAAIDAFLRQFRTADSVG